MRQANIILLDSSEVIATTTIGSKAANLVRMKRIGLPVPAGFIVGGSLYREHLERNKLISRVKLIVEEKDENDSAKILSLLSGLREAIIKAPMAEIQRLDIEKRSIRQLLRHIRPAGVHRGDKKMLGVTMDTTCFRLSPTERHRPS